MFSQFDYFSEILPDFPQIQTISRITGLNGMEEAMENIRSIKPLILLAEDTDSGFLDLSQGNFDNGYHTFTIIDQAKLSDSADRVRALNACMTAGLKIFSRMMADAQNFGDPCYGFDRSRVDYQRIGPLVNNCYGYMFSYVLRNENFKLV